MTRNERNRNTMRWLTAGCLAALMAMAAVAGMTQNAKATPDDDGRLPGDDKPATARCFLTDAEIAELVYGYDENQAIEDALMAKATKSEDVLVTYYCVEQRPHICGTGDGITASGREVTAGVSVAVPDDIPLGSTVILDYGDGEMHYYRADDHGYAITGKHIDVAVTTHQEAIQEGRKTATMYWVTEDAD